MVVRTGDQDDRHVMPCRSRGRGGLVRHGHEGKMLRPCQIGDTRIPFVSVRVLPHELLPFDQILPRVVASRSRGWERRERRERLFDSDRKWNEDDP